jgi:cytochrome c556
MKRWVAVGLGVCIAVGILAASGLGEQNDELKTFMRVKLKHSQKVVEGLVMEDFPAIAKNSQEMSLLSLAATWQVFETPEYLDYSRKFRAATDELSDAAKKKDLDRATVAYNKVTTRCVECHKYVRGIRMADASR